MNQAMTHRQWMAYFETLARAVWFPDDTFRSFNDPVLEASRVFDKAYADFVKGLKGAKA